MRVIKLKSMKYLNKELRMHTVFLLLLLYCIINYTLCFIKTWHYICDHNSGKSWRILIIFTYLETGMNAIRYLLIYCSCDANMTSLSRSWHWWAETASAARMARLRAVADWWRRWRWPMSNTLACLCSCHWWSLWTYLVTVNLYLMNFMFHTTLDAVV